MVVWISVMKMRGGKRAEKKQGREGREEVWSASISNEGHILRLHQIARNAQERTHPCTAL